MEISLVNGDEFNKITEPVCPGLSFYFGHPFAMKVLSRRCRKFRSGFSPCLQIGSANESQIPYSLPLAVGDHAFAAKRLNENLVAVTDNGTDLVFLARLGGIYEVPENFTGALAFHSHYETIFPGARVLPSLTGLMLTGYLQNITDASALHYAAQLRHLTIDTLAPGLGARINAPLHSLATLSEVFLEIPEQSLNELRSLDLRSSGLQSVLRAVELPQLEELRLSVYIKTKARENEAAFLGWIKEMALALDDTFPADLTQLGPKKSKFYNDGYMTDVSLDWQRFGLPGKGLTLRHISESYNDGMTFSHRASLEIEAYGLKHAMLKATGNAMDSVTLRLGGSRNRVLLALSLVMDIDPQTPRNASAKPVAFVKTPPTALSHKDANRENFLAKTGQFAALCEIVILPVLERVVASLTAQGVDAECKWNLEHKDEPLYYQASIYLTLWTKGRGQWAVFQYSHAAARLEPINLHIWNPDKWENEDFDVALADINESKVTADIRKFLTDVAKYFSLQKKI